MHRRPRDGGDLCQSRCRTRAPVGMGPHFRLHFGVHVDSNFYIRFLFIANMTGYKIVVLFVVGLLYKDILYQVKL